MQSQESASFPIGRVGTLGAEPALGPARGLWSDAWRRLIKNRLAVAAMILLALVVAMAFVGARVGPTARYGPDERDYSETAKEAPPSADHWFGTDRLGRDTFARVLEGTRVSIQIGLGTQIVVLVIGVAVGAAAALGGRWSDAVLMRFTDVMYAFPSLIAIILVRSVLFERDWYFITNPLVMIIVAIAFVAWTTLARLVRGQMLSLRERDYVIAARSMGASNGRVVLQHMLPNTLGPVIVAVTFGIPFAIFAEAALGFIGLGVPPPTASLGILVRDGYSTIQRSVWLAVCPAAAVGVLMLCFTFLGDGLRDALDPRTR
jgi:oligopeptide transport system permease protein